MELKRVILSNVRHFTHKVFEFSGNSEIVMQNKGGKSTLADAITFVLTGKLQSGSSDVATLKPLRNTAEEVSIELIYKHNEAELSLKKTYAENWVKTRGTTETTMSGHITDCYINDEKLSLTNFEKELCGLFNVESTKEINMMLNPYFFGQVMSWQERLEYINRVIGEITLADVFSLAPETTVLEEDIVKYGDGLKNKLRLETTDKKKLVSEKEIQIKADTTESTTTESEAVEAAAIINRNNEKMVQLKVKKEGLVDPIVQTLKAQKLELQATLQKSKEVDAQELADKNVLINSDIDTLRNDKNTVQDERQALVVEKHNLNNTIDVEERRIRENDILITRKQGELKNTQASWTNAKARTFEPIEKAHCPNCNFELTASENEAKEIRFNENKAEDLKKIVKLGDEVVNEIKKLNDEKEKAASIIIECKDKITKTDVLIAEKDLKIASLNQEILTLEQRKVFSFVSDKTEALARKLELLEENIKVEENKAHDNSEIDSEINQLKLDNITQQQLVDNYNAAKILKARKTQRESELAKLVVALADAEYKEDLLNIYNKTYLQILTERIKENFAGIHFQLIKTNIKEGSWQQVCYVLIESDEGVLVPYETANTASKIKIGVKLADVLASKLGWHKIPMIVDNAESITKSNRNFETDAQVISLVADDVATTETQSKEQIALEI